METDSASGAHPLRTAHFQALAALGLLVVAFWPILTAMYGSWFDSLAYMEHGILVVPAAACMVWTKRGRLREIRRAPSVWGIVWVILAAIQASFGMAAHWIWVSRVAVIGSLAGCVLAFYGREMLRELLYPLATLFLMIAPPTFLYERLTLGLQLLSGRLGEMALEMFGYPVLREGNILELVGAKLSIAEACSGIRSLPAILFVTVIYDFYFVEGALVRGLLLVMAAPAAIVGNGVRIVITASASQHDPRLAEGTAHETLGYVSVAISAAALVALHLLTLAVKSARARQRA